jgi:predicted nucleic acid-binding protein
MPNNSNIIISDTSCLILLDKIEALDLLQKLGNKVYITLIIKQEFGKHVPPWIGIKEPQEKYYQQLLELTLDKGESSAIALSLEFDNAIIIIDDLKARKIAERLHLKYSGTFGLFLKAKQLGLIDRVKPLLEKIKMTDFRFSEYLFETIIKEAGE